MSINRIVVTGRMTKDPEARTTNTGKTLSNFTVAVDKRIKSQDPNAPTADFFRVVAWNQQADFVNNYGGRGRLIAIDGRLETRKYQDKDGNNREVVEIVADSVNLLDRPADGQGGGEPQGYTARPAQQSTPQTYRPAPTTPVQAEEYDPFADE